MDKNTMNNLTNQAMRNGLLRWGMSALLLCGGMTLHAEGDNVIPTIQVGQSTLKVMGYAQSTYTVQHQDEETKNALEMQRFIVMADARITDKVSFWLMYDFSTSKIHEYYAQYAFSPALKLRIGQYKQPFTMESLLPPTLVSNIGLDESVAFMAGIWGDPCWGAGRVGRDLGVMLTGDLWPREGKPLLNYSIGVFNGAGMNQKENNNQKDLIGQVNLMPLSGTTFSASFILGTAQAQATSPYGRFAQGDNYKRNRLSVGADHKNALFCLRTEAMWGNDGGAKSMGWYANAEINLTKRLDLVANYDYLKRNLDLSDSSTQTLIGGLQYWVYKQCCVRSQFVYKDPRSGASTKMWVTQFQIAF